jgi:hypothetical protein
MCIQRWPDFMCVSTIFQCVMYKCVKTDMHVSLRVCVSDFLSVCQCQRVNVCIYVSEHVPTNVRAYL